MCGSDTPAVEQQCDVASGAAHHLLVAEPKEQPTTQRSPGSAKRLGYGLQGSFRVDLLVQHGAIGPVADGPQQVALEVRDGAIRLREPHMESPFAPREVNIEAKPWRR